MFVEKTKTLTKCLSAALILAGGIGSVNALSGKWYGELGVGIGKTRFRMNQNIVINPALTNGYRSRSKKDLTLPVVLGGGYEFKVAERMAVGVGGEAVYLDYGQTSGRVHPMINVAPNFDRVAYFHEGSSTMFMASVNVKRAFTKRIAGFISVSGGVSRNKLDNYNESIIPGSTGRPMLAMFRDRTRGQYAYGVGLGATYSLDSHITLKLAYRYLNAGKAGLNTTPIQTSNQRLSTRKLTSHLLTLSALV